MRGVGARSNLRSLLGRMWWSLEVALWGAAPIGAMKYVFPAFPGDLLLGLYLAAVAGILGLRLVCWHRRRIHDQRLASGECVNCGYSLRGLPTFRCPECGRAY